MVDLDVRLIEPMPRVKTVELDEVEYDGLKYAPVDYFKKKYGISCDRVRKWVIGKGVGKHIGIRSISFKAGFNLYSVDDVDRIYKIHKEIRNMKELYKKQ